MVEVKQTELEDEDNDSSDNEEAFSKLRASVSQLDTTQRVKPVSRKEVSSLVSEFHLTKVPSDPNSVVHVNELAQILNQKQSHSEIKKKFIKVTKKAKTLPKPLEKPAAEKIRRIIGFENVKEQLDKWNPIVTQNRAVDHIKFPLAATNYRLENSRQYFSKFQNETELEIEINKVLNPNGVANMDKEEDEFPLTLEEMLEKRKEMAKLRARQSFREAKAFRHSKIKSKKYHRLQRKEKIRQQLKEFETLQKTDPEAALKKLEELDKTRATERASLRHKNTGKWAQNLTIRAKYDKECRKELAQQLSVSRDLTQKAVVVDSSDDDAEEGQTQALHVDSSIPKDNPWAVHVSSEVTQFIGNYKKYWAEKMEKEQEKSRSDDLECESVLEKQDESGADVMAINNTCVTETERQQKSIMVQTPKDNSAKVQSAKKLPEIKSPRKSKGNTQTSVMGKEDSMKEEIAKKSSRKVESAQKSPRKRNGKVKDSECHIQVEEVVNFPSTSGLWVVTPVKHKKSKKRSSPVDIDDIFEDVDLKVLQKFNKKLKAIKSKFNVCQGEDQNNGTMMECAEEEGPDLTMKKVLVRPEMDEPLQEAAGGRDVPVEMPFKRIPLDQAVAVAAAAPVGVDPAKFIQVTPKHLRTSLPDGITNGEDAMDDDEETHHMNIMEAFGDDDVLTDFKELKASEEETTKLEEVNLELPGWGSWAGTDIAPSKRKKKMKVLKLPARKDKEKKDTIINEDENPKIKQHLVKDVPFPFDSVDAFEANIRAPIGREWVPETAHQKLIQKPVETQMGAIISPMNEEQLLKFTKKKSNFTGKTKSVKKTV